MLYHTFVAFVKRSIKVKRGDFRSDSDLYSEALYDKYIIDKYILQMDPQRTNDIEQITLDFLTKVLFSCKQ